MTKTLLEQAVAASAKAHLGQTDKAGQPYILHPLRIMMQMETETQRVAALLHDVVEDCAGWDFDRVREEFGLEVSDAVDALTKRPKEEYELYLSRIEANPVACRVKLADLADNSDMTRLPNATDEDWARHRKYQGAIARLKAVGR